MIEESFWQFVFKTHILRLLHYSAQWSGDSLSYSNCILGGPERKQVGYVFFWWIDIILKPQVKDTDMRD